MTPLPPPSMQAAPELPAPPQPPATGQVVIRPGVDAPQAVYRAFNEQRKELANQLENLEEKHRELARQLADPGTDKSIRAGLEVRVAELDKRISDVDRQLATADQAVAKAASVPGAVVEPPPIEHSGPPPEVFVLSGMFIVAVFLPLSIAFARRIWKRGSDAVLAVPRELSDRLDRLDHSVDSIAIEVERIGEGQRFMTRVMSDSGRALGAGPAQPIEAAVRGDKAGLSRERERG
ncbi:MAG: ABC transporter C-terminal domain-containing protein [bacterium]